MTASGLGIFKKWCRRSRNSIPTGTGEKISLKPRVNILHERQTFSVALIIPEIKIIHYRNLSFFKTKAWISFYHFWWENFLLSSEKFWIFSKNVSNLSGDISKTFQNVTKLKKQLKCNNSNSTLAVRSGFDLHRFLPVFGKKKIEKDLAGTRIQTLVQLIRSRSWLMVHGSLMRYQANHSVFKPKTGKNLWSLRVLPE